MPASRWIHCLAQILKHEGGYADHPADPGGATNMGITRKTLARWRRVEPWWALPKSEVKALTRTEAAAIYKALYWERCNAAKLPPGLDLAVFDFAVNSGPDRAVRTLQALVGVVQDGFVGPITLGAVAERDPRALIEALCDQRMRFLQRLSTWARSGAAGRTALQISGRRRWPMPMIFPLKHKEQTKCPFSMDIRPMRWAR